MSLCRICGEVLQDSVAVCPNCGRLALLFPDPLPEALQQCLAEEKVSYEPQMASEGALQQALSEKTEKNKELETTVAILQTKLEQKQKEIEALEAAKKSAELLSLDPIVSHVPMIDHPNRKKFLNTNTK